MQSPDHPHVATIRRYYDGCNAPDVELMCSTFTDDVVHYFVDHAPVRGAQGLATYWAKVVPKTRARWTLDHAIVQGDEAVIEWSMCWTPGGSTRPELLRGTEWYVFRSGKIAEIRSYHCNFHLQSPDNFELRQFPYAARGTYPGHP
jgi:ketosteroid isomerase-like protein